MGEPLDPDRHADSALAQYLPHARTAIDAVMRVNTGGFVTCAKHAFLASSPPRRSASRRGDLPAVTSSGARCGLGCPGEESIAGSHRTSAFPPSSASSSLANQRVWDCWLPLHLTSKFYSVEDFIAGGSSLRSIETSDSVTSVTTSASPAMPFRARHPVVGPARRRRGRRRQFRSRH